MSKKVQFFAEFEAYEPNPESYGGATEIKDMADIDLEGAVNDLGLFLDFAKIIKLGYKIIEDGKAIEETSKELEYEEEE